MKASSSPEGKAARLEALKAYGASSAGSDSVLEGIARVTAHILGYPIVLVSLVDTRRQWCVAGQGLDLRDSPREGSFCGHVVASGQPLAVSDAQQDSRFADHPWVTGEPQIRAYAGAPLRTGEGRVIGTLCALAREPREPSPAQLEMLVLLAAQVMDRLEARRCRIELAQERARSKSASPAQMHDGTVEEVSARLQDITAFSLATERAKQQERSATVGVLAMGIGHEINNQLACVSGNIDFALEELAAIARPAPSLRLKEVLSVHEESRESAERIRKIVRGLRALAREDVALNAVDLAGVIETSLTLVAHETRRKATIVRHLEGTRKVLADESRVTQILINLLLNAAQAFERCDPSMNEISVSTTLLPEGQLALSVSDNGPGIPAALLSRVFDPFFTTKPVGLGTGLGLTVSRKIAQTLGGELTVESQPGRGAKFTVLLRAAQEAAGAELPPMQATRRARVLVIDDDPATLQTMCSILAREHEVRAVGDGRDALQVLLGNPPFDLVLCDLTLEHIAGAELYEQARSRRAHLHGCFVFVVDGAIEPAMRAVLEKTRCEAICKPFAVADLLGLAHRFAARRDVVGC